jgi:branched-chain amino acid transport system substrate-binding protein
MRRILALAVAVAGVFGIVVAGSSASATRKASAAASCSAHIALSAPITGPAPAAGGEQLHFAQYAVATFNKQLHMHVSMSVNDDQLSAAVAVTRAQGIIASNAVAVVGPPGSQQVLAAGPLYTRAGMAFVTGSATLPKLTHVGLSTFFRVVPNDNVQGPQDANYVINKLHPKAVLIVSDDEAYSNGLVAAIVPILRRAGITVNQQTYDGTATGATLSNILNTLVSSQLKTHPDETVTMLPWQSAENAQQFGLDAKAQGARTTLFGTDGTDANTAFTIPGTYVSNFGPDISQNKSKLDHAIVRGVAKYGPYGSFGVPTYEAVHVVMKAIYNLCQTHKAITRSNVLAQVRKTYIAPADNALGIPIKFTRAGDLAGQNGFLFKILPSGAPCPGAALPAGAACYQEINPKTGAKL